MIKDKQERDFPMKILIYLFKMTTLKKIAQRNLISVGFVIVSFCLSSCSDSFKSDFKEITGEDFPTDAQFIYKEESPTDFNGDYGSVSQIRVESDFYQNLPNKLLQKGFIIDSIGPRLAEFENAETHLATDKINYQYKFEGRDVYYYVGFLLDNESIIVIRSSW